MTEKYLKNSCYHEKLTNCMQLCVDEKIRGLAKEQNDTKIPVVTKNELVTKEACYHFNCYRDYTRYINKISTKITDKTMTNDEFAEVFKFLLNL